MSASRLFLSLTVIALLASGCAYDPQMAAQYSADVAAEPIVGPQLPKRNRPSVYDLQMQKAHPEIAKTETAPASTSAETPKVASTGTKEINPAPAPLSDNPNLTADDLPLPKKEAPGTDSAPMTPPATEKTETKVEEKIVVDTNPPAAETTAAPSVETAPPAAAVPAVATASEPVAATPAPAVAVETPAAAPATPAPEVQEEQVAIIETKFGKITIELDPQAAPATVENFIKLTKDGFYNGTTFHRVIPDFMIQGGDPNSKSDDRSTHGKGGPDYTLPPEIKLKHKRGSVATARLPNNVNPQKASNGSQFYICVVDCPFLDGEYTVFGHVISGMSVVDRIAAQPRDEKDNPIQRIEMKVRLAPKNPKPATPAAAAPQRALPESNANAPANTVTQP